MTEPTETPEAAASPEANPSSQSAPAEAYAWLGDGLTDEDRRYLDAKKYGGPADVYKALRASETALRSGERVNLPKSSEAPENWEGWARLGAAASPEAYELAAPKIEGEAGEFFQYDEGLSKTFREAAHAAKLAPWQAAKIHDGFVAAQVAAAQQHAQAYAKDRADTDQWMRAQWGDKRQERLAAVSATAQKFGLEAGSADLDALAARVGSPKLLAMLDALAQTEADAAPVGGAFSSNGGGGVGGNLEPSEALRAFEAKHGEALLDKGHPERAALVKQWNDLVAAKSAADAARKQR